jgi:metaxin
MPCSNYFKGFVSSQLYNAMLLYFDLDPNSALRAEREQELCIEWGLNGETELNVYFRYIFAPVERFYFSNLTAHPTTSTFPSEAVTRIPVVFPLLLSLPLQREVRLTWLGLLPLPLLPVFTPDRVFCLVGLARPSLLMEFHSWSPAYGLPSMHPGCLAIHTYCKFLGVPVAVHENNNPLGTRSGDLPWFTTGGGQQAKRDRRGAPKAEAEYNTARKADEDSNGGGSDDSSLAVHGALDTFEEVVQYLKSEHFSTDYSLSAKERSECVAFKKLLEDKLAPAYEFVFWVDRQNASELSLPWYAQHLPFPLGWVYPKNYQTRAHSLVQCVTGVDMTQPIDSDSMARVENFITKNALECAQIISNRLSSGDERRPFFFGTSPSSLDALIFAYMAPILKAPLPNQTLKNKLSTYAELVDYVDCLSNRFFPRFANETTKSERMDGQDVPEENVSKRANMLAVLAATCAMLAYAYNSGIVRALKYKL